MTQRHEFIALALLPGSNVSELCRRFAVSHRTGRKWLKRYQAGGAAALVDHSRRTKTSPTAAPPAPVAAVLALRAAQLTWGPRKLRRRLEDLGHADLPARSTIGAILRRAGQITPAASQAATAWQRFEHPAPNALWQMDFQGSLRPERRHALPPSDRARRPLALPRWPAGLRRPAHRGRPGPPGEPLSGLRPAGNDPLRQRLALGGAGWRTHRPLGVAAAARSEDVPRPALPSPDPGQGRALPSHAQSRPARPPGLCQRGAGPAAL